MNSSSATLLGLATSVTISSLLMTGLTVLFQRAGDNQDKSSFKRFTLLPELEMGLFRSECCLLPRTRNVSHDSLLGGWRAE